jgi:hypothetical protein
MAGQAETRRSIESPQQTQLRSKRIVEQAAIRRSIETPQQTQIRLKELPNKQRLEDLFRRPNKPK